MPEWLGETTCKHYRGIKFSREKKCCGGKVFVQHRVDCAVKNIVYAHLACFCKTCERFSAKAD